MAFVSSDPTQDENDPESQAALQARLQASNPTTGGGAALFGSGAEAPASANGNPAPKSASSNSGWTNLSAYLNANKDQASNMGSQVANTIDQKAQGASDQVNDLSTGFNKQVQDNTTQYNADDVNKAITDATGLKAGQTYDPNDVRAFQKYAGASYGGPSDFTQGAGYGAAAQATSDAQNKLAETQSEAGRQSLLKDQFSSASKNGYSNGESALDQALVEGSPEAQKALGGVEQKWSGISNILNNAASAGNSAVANARATDAATAKAAADALGAYGSTDANGVYSGGAGALGAFSKNIYGQANDAESAYNTGLADIQNAAANNQYSDAQLKSLGLTAGQHTYGVQLTPQLIQAGLNPTVANTASADQYAQYQALAALAGALPGGEGTAGTAPLNAANVAQAGTGAGVNGNAFYKLAPTYASDVQAAEYGAPSEIASILNNHPDYSQNTYSASGFDPSKQTFNLSSAGNYGPTTSATYSLDPNAPNYIGNASELSPVTEDANGNKVTNSIANTPAWQSLMAQLTGTIGAAPTTPNGAQTPVTTPIPVGAHFAHGGMVPSPAEALSAKLARPMKEPKIPALPKADVKLPKLPRFAEGGDVLDANARAHIAPKNFAEPSKHKYPIENEAHARNALARVAQFGSDHEKEVVRRQVHAHYPHLAAEAYGGQLPPVKQDVGDAMKAGGKVPGTPKVSHNSYQNDSTEARLTPGEVVLPLSVTKSRDPVKAAADFMAQTLLKKAVK